jgi:serine/threonine protein kinase
MSSHSPRADWSLPPSGSRRVDQACDAFEAAWRAGQRPRLETYLDGAAGPERSALFAELLKLELAYRGRAGETPAAAEYQERFPELAALVGAVFRPPGARDSQANTLAYVPANVADGMGAPTVAAPAPAATAPAAPPLEVPPTGEPEPAGEAGFPVIPPYEILEELGRGGMGVVYKARDAGCDRLVALKMIRAGVLDEPQALARFHVEAEAVARLDHPNVVRILTFAVTNGRPYFAMEFLAGGNLAQKLGGSPLSPRQAAQLAQTLARATHYVHGQNIVHRDLKPANVLFTAEGTPKIADFGLAKRLDRDKALTETYMVMGTAGYMAPEQAAGQARAVGPAADVYALGAILYEMLTGRPPFLGETHQQTLDRVLSDEPVPPSHLQPEVQPELEAICLKCLEKEPARRYASGEALAEDLSRFLAGEPVSVETRGEWEWRERWALRAGYELLDVLTCGVRDVVYKARQTELDRSVALKVIAAMDHSEPARVARFRREATLVGKLRHPNIVQVYYSGELNGLAYFSTEYLDGGSLIDQFVDRPVPAARAAELVAPLARAVHYAHQQGVVHCAIKPSNVLLTADGVPKITNFSLAVLLEKEQEETERRRALQRLPSYQAPELADGQFGAVGPAADVYSLGAVLYKLLTGGPPFLGETVEQTREQVRSQEPVPPGRLQPGVPHELEAICLKCLQKAPAGRYASAEELAEALQRFLARKQTDTDEFEVIPGYEIFEELGRGSLGVVYRARRSNFDYPVALKIFDRLPPERLARIRAAHRAVFRVRHPNLVEVYDGGEKDGLLYAAEELVEGTTLERQLGGRPQPPRPAARLVETLAEAVHQAHLSGIVHRNLKLRNILLDRLGRPKVGSFELARLLTPGAQLGREEALVGTPRYMAPEQAAGHVEQIGPATDVYALGNILYEMLTGRPPFQGETLSEMEEQLRSSLPVPPGRLRPGVPADLDAVCLKCLEKDPARRYPSALALAEDLGRFRKGEPVRVRDAGFWVRVVKWFRRRLWRREI